MTLWQKIALYFGIILSIVIGTAGTTWFAADAYYGKKLTALQATDKQAAADQAAEDAVTLSRYATAAQEVNNEAKSQIAAITGASSDLRVRLADAHEALGHCSNDSVRGTMPEAIGSGTGSDKPATAGSTATTEPTVSIPRAVLEDDLLIGINAIKAEKEYRDLLRAGGQVAP